MKGGHVIVGISGGIDSAVAAWLLQQQGYRVSGMFMVNWTEDEEGYCSAAEDYQMARAVCAELDIPLHRADFSAEYRDRVFHHFLANYAAGKTPNPDVLCNREIKFQPFREHALRLGAQWVATGHYARIEHTLRETHLLRASDENKDQTYFLAAVERKHFAQVLFPLGSLTKTEVREIGRRAGLPNYARRDSTGICFIGERNFQAFLGRHLPPRPGPIQDEHGAQLGSHCGLAHYTLGQRRGLKIGGRRGFPEAPWYVIGKNAVDNTLTVAQDPQHPWLLSRQLVLREFNWLCPPHQIHPTDCLHARIRHRQTLQPCMLAFGSDHASVSISFTRPQRAAVPGQYAVLYHGARCIGGGEILTTDAPGKRTESASSEALPL